MSGYHNSVSPIYIYMLDYVNDIYDKYLQTDSGLDHTHTDNMSVFLEIRQYIVTQDIPSKHIIGACISYLSLYPILEKYNILGADFSLSPN